MATAFFMLLGQITYGQVTANQTAELEKTCGPLTLELNASSFSFNSTTVAASNVTTFGNTIGPSFTPFQNGTDTLPSEALVTITDLRGPGCNPTQPGFLLTVTATNFRDDMGTPGDQNDDNTFASDNLRVVTTTNINGTSGTLQGTGDSAAYYDLQAGSTDLQLQYNVGNANLTQESTFTDELTNTLSESVPLTIIYNPAEKVGIFETGTAYALEIPGATPGGTYTSTITYTIQESA